MARKFDPDLPIWECQVWETAKAAYAFQHYLAIGPKRTFEKGAIAAGYKSDASIRDWVVENLWVERATAWDKHLMMLTRKAMETDHVEMNRRQAEMFRRAQEIASDKMELLNCEDKLPSWMDLSKIMSDAAKGERTARGTPDTLPGQVGVGVNVVGGGGGSITTTISSGFNLEALNDNELDSLLEIMEKVGADSSTIKSLLGETTTKITQKIDSAQVIDHE